MTTDTNSRTAQLLALMKRSDDVTSGSAGALPGINHPQGTRRLLSRLLSRSLAVCADHTACVTPAHPVRHEAQEGAQRGRAHPPWRLT